MEIWESRLDRGWTNSSFSHANFWDVQDQNRAFASVGATSGLGRRKLERQALKPLGSGSGESTTESTNCVVSGSGARNPSSDQAIGLI